jgi:hypothetical protein
MSGTSEIETKEDLDRQAEERTSNAALTKRAVPARILLTSIAEPRCSGGKPQIRKTHV